MSEERRYTLIPGDVLDFCREYEGEKFHAALLDPPYHLTSITRRFGKEGSKPPAEGVYRRASRGFMSKQWDGGDIAFRLETWKAIASLLHPGALIIAFAGTRGYHRMACAAEDAGLIVHPCMGWCFGSGFPKATRIGKFERNLRSERGSDREQWRFERGTECDAEPVDDTARVWQHHRYGLQALKPALEIIGVFQVPYRGKPVTCITTTGAGAWNIGAGRIGSEIVKTQAGNKFPALYKTFAECPESERSGRWPANLLLESGFIAAELDRQSGVEKDRPAKAVLRGEVSGKKGNAGGVIPSFGAGARIGYQTEGGASRFFFRSNWHAEIAERLSGEFPLLYRAKAGRRERDAGLNISPTVSGWGAGGFQASNPIRAMRRNPHPTVKPLALTRYLASLLLPPDEYAPRRLFCPFAGSGSEAIGGILAGWEQVTAIEREAEYCRIAEARLRFWSCNSGLFEEITADSEADEEEAVEPQGVLF